MLYAKDLAAGILHHEEGLPQDPRPLPHVAPRPPGLHPATDPHPHPEARVLLSGRASPHAPTTARPASTPACPHTPAPCSPGESDARQSLHASHSPLPQPHSPLPPLSQHHSPLSHPQSFSHPLSALSQPLTALSQPPPAYPHPHTPLDTPPGSTGRLDNSEHTRIIRIADTETQNEDTQHHQHQQHQQHPHLHTPPPTHPPSPDSGAPPHPYTTSEGVYILHTYDNLRTTSTPESQHQSSPLASSSLPPPSPQVTIPIQSPPCHTTKTEITHHHSDSPPLSSPSQSSQAAMKPMFYLHDSPLSSPPPSPPPPYTINPLYYNYHRDTPHHTITHHHTSPSSLSSPHRASTSDDTCPSPPSPSSPYTLGHYGEREQKIVEEEEEEKEEEKVDDDGEKEKNRRRKMASVLWPFPAGDDNDTDSDSGDDANKQTPVRQNRTFLSDIDSDDNDNDGDNDGDEDDKHSRDSGCGDNDSDHNEEQTKTGNKSPSFTSPPEPSPPKRRLSLNTTTTTTSRIYGRKLSEDSIRVFRRQRSQEVLLARRAAIAKKSCSVDEGVGANVLGRRGSEGLFAPLRRLSDLRQITHTLGLHIHGSLLHLATEKSRKQSDQMVSLSFRTLESYITEENLVGLQTFLATRSVVIDDKDENGATALHLAASRGKPELCNELIIHGADVNAEDNDQWTAVIVASRAGHMDTVATLVDHGANIHQKDMGGWTALMWACYKGHSELARYLLTRGADPSTQGQHHMTALVWAAGRGHTEIVHYLLDHGAKSNVGDKFGTTPLIWACRKGYYAIAEDLLRHGASVDASGMYSWTPLLVATRGNYVDLVSLLLEHRPNLNAMDKDGGTALTIACKEGYTEIATALLNGGAYVNMQDRNGDTNLIYAARGGHRAVVEALLKKYADVDCVGKDRKTALYWAVEKGHTSVVKIILSANPNLEHTTKEGDTCLLRAVRNKNAEVVQLLIDKKSKVNVVDKKGDTALHIAMRGRSKRIVEILLRNPKNSQLLYRPNRSLETPYNIDLSNQKTILGQIFGARRLNTNEDNENMLGYDLYSSSLADILSEPSLSMPISVGLYAKWGSGKSFLIRKLKEEMGSFAKQWVEPLFQISPLAVLVVVHIALLVGLLTAVPSFNLIVGLAVGGSIFILLTVFLFIISHSSRRYDWNLWYRWSVGLERQMSAFKLVLQVIFCSPAGAQRKEWKDGVQARPLKFIFAEGAKPSSTAAGENSVVQMLGSLFDMVEREYGMFATRFYRAFRPKAQGTSSPWKYRRLCGIPYVVIFFVTLACLVVVGVIGGLYGFHPETPLEKGEVRATESMLVSDDIEEDDDVASGESSEENEYYDNRPYHGHLMNPLLITLGVLVAVVVVANLHTLVRMVYSLVFSHRCHLLHSVAKLETIKTEGYLQTLKNEVNLMVEMVKCLDAFTVQQTRLVVVVDGLDSCEQEKVLSVLDAVHTLFTDSSAPFIILLAIDPHIITRAIEQHVHRVFNESSISGHDYLRNIVHLPFYLQNSGLRKVKQAQQAAERMRGRSQSTWLEVETDSVSLATTSAVGGISHIPIERCLSNDTGFSIPIPANRRLSSESGMSASQNLRRNNSKTSRRTLKPSDSIASSIGSNLNRVGGAQDLTKVLLTDDYFSDINPRSMRRLMNVVYITGRLLKAFHIDFNWYHLASWINITEQWPYRASWLILYYEAHEEALEEKTSLKDLYEKIKNQVPISKDMDPLLEMDKEEKKFEIFLSMHKNSLHISDLKVFLPFTINLDPFIRKVIKEDQPQFEDGPQFIGPPAPSPWSFQPYDGAPKSATTPRRPPMRGNQKNSTASLPPLNPMMWGYGPPPPFMPSIQSASSVDLHHVPITVNPVAGLSPTHASLPPEVADKKLSTLSVDGLFEVFSKVEGVSASLLPTYKEKLQEHNINGKVLLHCDLDDLKKVLHMNFGDWELFRILILGLREREVDDDYLTKNVRFADHSHGHHDDLDTPDGSLVHSSLTSHPGSMEGSLARRGSSRTSSMLSSSGGVSSGKERDDAHNSIRKTTKQNLLAKQTSLGEDVSSNSGEEDQNLHHHLHQHLHHYLRDPEDPPTSPSAPPASHYWL
ncbi:kinase D-interacting substrate of 220 kDa B-like isoform X3 [Portunus trituberculatus]|uniref:kinase D-interacting substrate of 220 kDa B-like isoform X3 n=1 Tax=Portunus trituberculatus TaxID=210409 RepID=UPI001E1CFB10|nr:kinase D-interacting substrate of 220 kDa B-like isoform X3 [Portunus trituberculatus]